MSVVIERNLMKEKSIHIVNGRCSDCIGVKNTKTGTPRQYSWHDCYCRNDVCSYTRDGELSSCSLKMIKQDYRKPINLNINDEIRVYKQTFEKDSYLMMDNYKEVKVIDIYPAHHIEFFTTKSIDYIVEKEVCEDLVYYYTKEKLLKEINSLDRYRIVHCMKECLDAEILKAHPHVETFYPGFYEQRGSNWIGRGLDMKGNHIILLTEDPNEEQLELLI